MKKHAWIIVLISIVIAVSGCTSKPKYGYKFEMGSFFCFTVENYESQNYEARLYDGSGDLIATVQNLEVKESTGRYSTGLCELTATFTEIPLGSGPYKIDYLLNGDIIVDTREFETLMEY